MAALVGTWDYVSAEKMDEYMTATAVPDNLKEIIKKSKPTMNISQNGDSWSLKTTVSDKVEYKTFKVGEEFRSKSLTGQDVQCTVTMDGERMVETQKAGPVTIVITREVQGDQLVSTMTVGVVTATVYFKRA
ncbi:sodium/calcium exchanger regulatory protein 1-like [Dreissena polymorpha]|uniref:sodium/calcium exchanger regulatory protein 1-like n=1 Tax=Dreissena polymorpha TaxID=45954 RepID=UPI0022656D96|nr:sodium/calcium exchanger regulatory protein 1-like [Dreissena polymorpha]